MLSGEFHQVSTASISVAEDRQRQDIPEDYIESLAESIRNNGLINPITITRNHDLVAGECRLRAHKLLGFEVIAVQYIDELSRTELEKIELEENIRRKNLTWQEEVKAVVRLHELLGKSVSEVSNHLNLSERSINRYLQVERNMDIPEVSEALSLSAAHNFSSRREERAATVAKGEVSEVIDKIITPSVSVTEPAKPKPPRNIAEIFHDSAHGELLSSISQPFNLIHCDFPYGINATKSGQSSAKNIGGYEDTEEVYWNLIETLRTAPIAESAHMIFWHSMNFHEPTCRALVDQGWRVFPVPLVWIKSDNRGILADSNRQPRNITEFAFLCSRGDRKIVRATSNAYHGPTTKQFHMSEKPYAMLTHFFRMLVDESTRLLDPTCGSGMAVKVARDLGAEYSLGIEMNEDYANDARRNLEE